MVDPQDEAMHKRDIDLSNRIAKAIYRFGAGREPVGDQHMIYLGQALEVMVELERELAEKSSSVSNFSVDAVTNAAYIGDIESEQPTESPDDAADPDDRRRSPPDSPQHV